MHASIARFFSSRWAVPQDDVLVTVRPVLGGLESCVVRAHVARRSAPSNAQNVIVKALRGDQVREGTVYSLLWDRLDPPPAARMLGTQEASGAQLLYLEQVAGASGWPWSDVEQAARVCRVLARLHDSAAVRSESLSWDYEGHLMESAHATRALAHTVLSEDGSRVWRRAGDLERIIARLPALRTRLLSGQRTLIHGDVHPGNVVLRLGTGDDSVALVDWGRARLGSPLEDVASWLHSLGCWEPEARRRHDTLLRAYLDARGTGGALSRELRELYTYASVSNGLSGAIRYHIAVIGDRSAAAVARQQSSSALAAWTRVVRRAAEWLRVSPLE